MPRTRSSRPSRSTDASPAEVYIPEKLYFRIGEVSKLTHTKPYVLRFWETEFPTLKPTKSKSGHRLYRRQDVELVLEIKRLLYGKGFTISRGAQSSGHQVQRRGRATSSLRAYAWYGRATRHSTRTSVHLDNAFAQVLA
jgi:DNA-binding transcriptional MerR regulator